MTKCKEWKQIKVYECPCCGQLERTMDDACNHRCAREKTLDRSTENPVVLNAYEESILIRKLKGEIYCSGNESNEG